MHIYIIYIFLIPRLGGKLKYIVCKSHYNMFPHWGFKQSHGILIIPTAN